MALDKGDTDIWFPKRSMKARCGCQLTEYGNGYALDPCPEHTAPEK